MSIAENYAEMIVLFMILLWNNLINLHFNHICGVMADSITLKICPHFFTRNTLAQPLYLQTVIWQCWTWVTMLLVHEV